MFSLTSSRFIKFYFVPALPVKAVHQESIHTLNKGTVASVGARNMGSDATWLRTGIPSGRNKVRTVETHF